MQVFLFWCCSNQSPPPLGFCDLSARTYFKDILHFERVRCLGFFKNRHDSIPFSYTAELTSHHQLLRTHKGNEHSTVLLELIFAMWYSILDEKLLSFPVIGKFLSREQPFCLQTEISLLGQYSFLLLLKERKHYVLSANKSSPSLQICCAQVLRFLFHFMRSQPKHQLSGKGSVAETASWLDTKRTPSLDITAGPCLQTTL